MNSQGKFLFYGDGPAATGPKVDPEQEGPVAPQFGIYAQNPSPESPWRMVGELAAGRYLCWEEPPRVLSMPTYHHDIVTVAPLEMMAGNIYYLRVSTPGILAPKSSVEVISEQDGQRLLKECKPPDGYDQ